MENANLEMKNAGLTTKVKLCNKEKVTAQQSDQVTGYFFTMSAVLLHHRIGNILLPN
jgi:hypothetical protein